VQRDLEYLILPWKSGGSWVHHWGLPKTHHWHDCVRKWHEPGHTRDACGA